MQSFNERLDAVTENVHQHLGEERAKECQIVALTPTMKYCIEWIARLQTRNACLKQEQARLAEILSSALMMNNKYLDAAKSDRIEKRKKTARLEDKSTTLQTEDRQEIAPILNRLENKLRGALNKQQGMSSTINDMEDKITTLRTENGNLAEKLRACQDDKEEFEHLKQVLLQIQGQLQTEISDVYFTFRE